MTDQMIQPVIKIDTLVDTIYKNHMQLSHEEVVGIVDEMSEQTRMVTQLLDKTIEVSLNNNTEAQ